MIALRNGGDFQACGLAFVNSDAPFLEADFNLLEADFNRRSFSVVLSNGYPPPIGMARTDKIIPSFFMDSSP